MCGAFKDFKRHQPNAYVPEFTHQEKLTMFADYRVPQILRHLGIFVYAESLAKAIDKE